jgi:hypothetical protein
MHSGANASAPEPEASAEQPALPDGWEVAVSRSTGEEYYYNASTGESSYEWPAGARSTGEEYYYNASTTPVADLHTQKVILGAQVALAQRRLADAAAYLRSGEHADAVRECRSGLALVWGGQLLDYRAEDDDGDDFDGGGGPSSSAVVALEKLQLDLVCTAAAAEVARGHWDEAMDHVDSALCVAPSHQRAWQLSGQVETGQAKKNTGAARRPHQSTAVRHAQARDGRRGDPNSTWLGSQTGAGPHMLLATAESLWDRRLAMEQQQRGRMQQEQERALALAAGSRNKDTPTNLDLPKPSSGKMAGPNHAFQSGRSKIQSTNAMSAGGGVSTEQLVAFVDRESSLSTLHANNQGPDARQTLCFHGTVDDFHRAFGGRNSFAYTQVSITVHESPCVDLSATVHQRFAFTPRPPASPPPPGALALYRSPSALVPIAENNLM